MTYRVLVSAHLLARAHVRNKQPKSQDGRRKGEESSSPLGNEHGGTAAQLCQGQLQNKLTLAVREPVWLHAC